jgi:integrase
MSKIAKKIIEVTTEMWQQCNPFNIQISEEFLNESIQLSPKTYKQYESALRIFFFWVKEYCENKSILQIKSKDYLKYQNWLSRNGLAEATIRIKRSAISSLNGYIMLYYEEEYPTFRNFITRQIKVDTTGFVHKKEPLNPDEYKKLCDELERLEEWQKLAYVKFSYATGCRREEARQLLKEIITYEPIKKKVKIKDEHGNETEMDMLKYKTHDTRCKGKGRTGSVRKLELDDDAMSAIKKWLEVRGEDENPYVFVSKYKNKINQVNPTTFNEWCNGLFENIIGRRIHPHLFRESRATNLVVYGGKNIEVARKLLGHKSSETTKIYVIKSDEDDADEAFV